MCRRHIISITPHKERSVVVKINILKISVSERRDLFLGNILSCQYINVWTFCFSDNLFLVFVLKLL